MRATARRRNERFERIVLAFVVATGGRLPEGASDLLTAISAKVPSVTLKEIADALRWSLRRSSAGKRSSRPR